MVAGAKSKNVITKTKTFSGCWTCRARKVKCDALRPQCLRCERAKIDCGGYGIKLFWVGEGEETSVSSIKRQAMSMTTTSPWYLDYDIVEQNLAQIDLIKAASSVEAAVFGPFGIFRLQRGSDSPDVLTDTLPFYGEPNEESTSPSDVLNDLIPPHNKTLELDELDVDGEIDTIHCVEYEQTDLLKVINLNKRAGRAVSISALMQNYILNVTNVLQPFRHVENTYKSMYVPTALMVSEKVMLESIHLPSEVSFPQLAIFFSILSTSAFHLRGNDHAMPIHDLGISFRSMALAYLRRGLQILPNKQTNSTDAHNGLEQTQLQAVLSAMLTLVTADVMDGQMAEFWIHLHGAKEVLKQLSQSSGLNSSIYNSVTILRFLTIIADSTSTTLTPLLWNNISDHTSEGNLIQAASHGLEYTYGITPPLANFIHQTTLLYRHVSYYLSKHQPLPSDLSTTCEHLYARLASWSINSEDLKSFANDEPITVLIAQEHICAFAQSIRIYFHTRLMPCETTELQTLVRSVADHLNTIECIKKDTNYDTTQTASVTWPGFIASCEAEHDDRDVWRTWWSTMLQYRIGNVSTLWSIVQEAWDLRDSGFRETPAWLPVLRQSGRRILAV